jgi:hypothetical protein
MVLDEPQGTIRQVVCMLPRRAISWLVEHFVLLDDKPNICMLFASEIRTCIQGQRCNGAREGPSGRMRLVRSHWQRYWSGHTAVSVGHI